MAEEPNILAVWNRVRHGFEASEGLPSAEVRVKEWTEALDAIRGVLAVRPGVAERFRPPSDLDVFMREVGAGYETHWGTGFALLGPDQMRIEFRSYYRDFVLSRPPGEWPTPDGAWLWIGTSAWMDKYDYFACCDTSHACYGAVHCYKDGNPYLNSPEAADDFYPSLAALLEWLASRDEPENRPGWLIE